jgi:glyoxylase-like metal-dependent hydrolase (beta-lactamase superfamily II)
MTVWHEIGDRIWVRRYQFYDQTIGVVGGDGGLLVIDTRTSHRQAAELRTDLAELRGAVGWVVNTHHHHDHCFGNSIFAGAEMWGQARCPTRLVEHAEEMRAELLYDLPEQADEWREVVVTPPTRTFDEHARLDLGGRLVELRHLGRGHTDNDVVVTVPDARVLFAGDLLENGAAPYFGDGYPLDWPATIEAIQGLDATTISPGHGPVADRAFVERSLEEIRTIADLGRRVAAGALSVDDAIGRSPYKPHASREPIERAAAQARGELDPV